MLIVCPSCASEYTIDPAKLGEQGRPVRCAICRDTWFVANPDRSGEPADPAASAPGEMPAADVSAERPQRQRTRQPKAKPSGPRRMLAGAALALALIVAGTLTAGRFSGEPWRLPAERISLALGLEVPGRGLAFRNVVADVVGAGAESLLVVEGEIVSLLQDEIHLPKLEFSVRNAADQVLATWTKTPPRPMLGAGEAVRFQARLAQPPADGRLVHIVFVAGGVDVAAHETR